MRLWTLLLFAQLAATPAFAQLDSGAVVRLHWHDGSEKARLLEPLGPASPIVHYCRYPSPVCGPATVNPPLARATRDLARIDRREGNRAGRGALLGLAFGTIGGLFVVWSQQLGNGSSTSRGGAAATVGVIAASWAGIGALIGAMSDDWKPVDRTELRPE